MSEGNTRFMIRPGRSHRDILDDIRGEGKFAEFLILAWGIMEVFLDNAILTEFIPAGTSTQKARYLVERTFDRKLNLMRSLSYLSDDEYGGVNKCQKARNDLFHNGGVFVLNLGKAKEEELMDDATKAVDAIYSLHDRVSSHAPLVDSKPAAESSQGVIE